MLPASAGLSPNALDSLRQRLEQAYEAFTRPPERLQPSLEPPLAGPGAAQMAETFSSALSHLLQDVETKQSQAEQAVKMLLTGGDIEVHQVMMAVEKAGLSFQMLASVRSRLLEAYQEMMHLQL